MRLILVRHSAVNFRPDIPSKDWHLSAAGRVAADTLASDPLWEQIETLYTSSEPKAISTAQRIAAPREVRLQVERDLGEVDRPLVDDGSYRDRAATYLRGEAISEWEPRAHAQDRIRRTVDRLLSPGDDVALVSHGLVLTLLIETWQTHETKDIVDSWEHVRFPDVSVIDTASGTVLRTFGE